MPDRDDEFDQIIKGWNVNTPTESIDPNPYGTPAQPSKSGLTKRGKAALGFGVAVIAGSSLIGYQVHENNAVKEQEIALKAQQLDLEKMQEMDRASEATQKVQNAQSQTRQASIDSCVKNHSDQVGKGLGSPLYGDIVNDCQAQYSGTASSDKLQTTATTQNTGGGGVNQGVLIGGGVLVVFLVVAAKRGTRSNPA